MYERIIKFNSGLFSATSVSKLDEEVEVLTNYVNSLDIKDIEIKYFEDNIIYLYDTYRELMLQNVYDEVLDKCGMSKVFNNNKSVKVTYSEEEKTISIVDDNAKLDRLIGAVINKMNDFYKI